MRGGLIILSQFACDAMRCDCYWGTVIAYAGVGGGMAMEDATGESGYDTEDDSLGDTVQEEEGRGEDSIACQSHLDIII